MRNGAIGIYIAYFIQFFKQKLEYRGDFIAGILANIILTLSGLLFIVCLFAGEGVRELGSWSRDEVLFIYGYSMISMALFSSVAMNLYGFSDRYIIQGEFDRVLLRPLGTLPQVLFESFNLDSIGSLLIGLVTLGFAAYQLELSPTLFDIIWLVVSTTSGAIILLSVFVTLASFSFHFEDRIGINPPFYNMIAFGRYPLPIFHPIIQFILQAIVPFAFVAFYPATHYFSHEGFELLCYATPLVAGITTSVAVISWSLGVRKYTSTGS